jgi:hypothetical protein
MIHHRPFMRSFRSTSVVFAVLGIALGAAACSAATDAADGSDNSTGTGGDGSNMPAPDSGVTTFTGVGDASPASASLYNSLCHFVQGVSPCKPDDTAPPPSNTCSAGDDAGAGTPPTIDGGDAGPSPIACHVTLDSASTDTAPACTSSGTGGNGAQCLGSLDCAAGFECVGSPGVCRRYCCTLPGTCDANSFCDVQAETSAGSVKVPICEPVQPCQLMGTDPTCGAGETCGIVNQDDGTTSCLSAGPADVGEDCDDTHCKENLVCLGDVGAKKCFALCSKLHPNCASGETCTGAAPLFQGDNSKIGVCE